MEKFLKLLFFVLLATVCSGYVSYKDYKVYDVTPTTEQFFGFTAWQYEEGFDFWQRLTPGKLLQVSVAPERQNEFEDYLRSANITNSIYIEDLEILLEEERRSMARNRRLKPTALPDMVPDFSIFWSSAEMEAYSEFLAITYPQFIRIETLGFTPERRRVYALRISNGIFGNKPVIAMESGMHAREWVCPPTVFYLIHRLVEDPATRNELLADVDWLIVPMQNPDGYEFSRTSNRMWRQNRRQVQEINPTCVGVDLNRNNPHTWRPAAWNVPCGSLTYPGPTSASEPETQFLLNLIERYNSTIKLYLSVHSFGDMVLWPWGYTRDAGLPRWIDTHVEHHALGNLWRNDILARGGRPYLVGNVADVLGPAFGAVDDHMSGHFNIPYVYTLELTSGFDFRYPESRIQALSIETFWGYRAMALHIGREFRSTN